MPSKISHEDYQDVPLQIKIDFKRNSRYGVHETLDFPERNLIIVTLSIA